MPNEKLQSIVNELNKFINVSTKEDLVLEILSPSSPSSDGAPNKTLLGKIASSVISAADGALETLQVIKDLEQFGGNIQELDKLITIHSVKENFFPSSVTIPKIIGEKFSDSKLSAYVMKSVQLLPATRDVNAIILFLTTIPTVEMSRAVPFLNIEVQISRPVFEPGTKRLQAMSLARFLEGSFDASNSPNDQNLLAALGEKDSQGEDTQRSISGMELFTSPQTLVNPDSSLDNNRAAPVIDKFRPFMSIENFSAELVPHVGFFAYRKAELNITLHDRSRLADIADFIRPDLYQGTELLVEWGWSHPSDTIFGQLIDSMKMKEKMNVINASFSMTKSGEVKLKLDLATKGLNDFLTLRIGDDKTIITAADAVRKLQRKIGDMRNKVKEQNKKGLSYFVQNKKGIKEIRGTQSLFSSAEDLNSSLTLTKTQRKQLSGFISKNSKSDDVKELQKLMKQLFVGDESAAKSMRSTVASAINAKLDIARNKNKNTEDPFINSTVDKVTNYVSFGKLMLLFVGIPLSSDDSYDDIQFLFYPFNHRAGRAKDINVSEFAIDINELRIALNAIATSRRGVNIQLKEFVQFINNNFIDDQASINYGMKGLYHTEIDEKTGTRKLKTNKKEKRRNDKDILNEQEKIIKELGIPDGIFKMPTVDIWVETIPGSVVSTGESVSSARSKTILKIHIFDRTCTRYESLGDLMRLSRVNDVGTIGSAKSESDDKSEHRKLYKIFLEKMKSRGIISKKQTNDGSNDVYELAGGVKEIKQFITENVPTIVYGTNNSGITDASFNTIQEPLLSTVHMIKAGTQQNAVTPEGLSAGNLPLQTLPAQASISIFGCPLIGYMQQFFVDFGTNTTMDNIYGVYKVTHELSQGKFESKLSLEPLDAYGEYRTLQQTAGAATTEMENLEN